MYLFHAHVFHSIHLMDSYCTLFCGHAYFIAEHGYACLREESFIILCFFASNFMNLGILDSSLVFLPKLLGLYNIFWPSISLLPSHIRGHLL